MGLFSTAVIAQYGPPINIDYLIIAGGGGAGPGYNGTNSLGGGGAGGFISGSATVTPGYTNLAVSVGPGGLRTNGATIGDGEGNDGNNSIFLGLTAYGGGGGGNSKQGSGTYVGPGRPGGSGGGGGARRNSANTQLNTAVGGAPVVGQGFTGGGSYSKGAIDGASYTWAGGSGGGAGGSATSSSAGVNSQPGPEKAWLDGFTYAGGGGFAASSPLYATSGSGGRCQFNTSIGTEGKNGLVKLRYSGSVALFTGGQINISGGYVYHSFNVGAQPAFAPGVNTDYTLYYTGG